MKSLLKGQTVTVTRYARPCRVAFILNTKNAREELLKLIEWCTFNLGGPHNSIFLQKSLRKSFFKELLTLCDPDWVIWIGNQEKSVREFVDALLPFQNDQVDMFNGETSLLGIALPKFVKEWKSKLSVTLSATPPDDRISLASAAIMGILSEEHKRSLSQWFDFKEQDYRNENEQQLMTGQPFSGMISANMRFMPGGISYFEPCYEIDEERGARLFESCVVVDKADNLEAISLFWNLRAVHHRSEQIFFLPVHFLESNKSETERFLWGASRTRTKGVAKILTCSLAPRDLADRIRGIFPIDARYHELSKGRYQVEKEGQSMIADLTVAHPGDLFERGHRYYGEQDPTAVTFDENGGYLQIPQSKLGASDRQAYHVVDFDIPFFKPAKSERMQEYLGFGDSQRLSRLGLSELVGGYGLLDNLLYLRLLDDLAGIRSVASDHGLTVRASDKGKMATQLLSMIGNPYEVRFLSGSNVISYLRKQAELRKPKISMNQSPEYPLNYSGICQNLKSPYTQSDFVTSLIRWMLRKQLLRAGIVVRCDQCYTQQFIIIDSIRHEQRCVGCRSLLEVPSDGYHHLELYYVPNTLLMNAIGQGFLPHLLALYFLTVTNHDGRSYENLTFSYPGIEIMKGQKSLGELDFALIFDNEIITGECKMGTELTKAEIAKTVSISKQIGASAATFCTTSKFPKRTVEEINRVGRKNQIKTVVLGGEDLTNQSYLRSVLRRNRNGNVVPDPKLYCDDVIRNSRRA
jgi:hypothetical protein